MESRNEIARAATTEGRGSFGGREQDEDVRCCGPLLSWAKTWEGTKREWLQLKVSIVSVGVPLSSWPGVQGHVNPPEQYNLPTFHSAAALPPL